MMPFIMSVITSITADIIASSMGLMFYYFLFQLIFQRNPRSPKELRLNEHIYYPVRFYVPVSKIVCEYVAFILITVSLKLWIRGYWWGGKNVAAIVLVYALITAGLPFEKKVKRIIINTEGITLEYRVGGCTHYLPDRYAGYEGKNLFFEEPDGNGKTVKLRFLCREDRYAVVQDLNMLKQTGKLTLETVTKVDEAWIKEKQQFLEEKQKLYADAKRYEQYLKEEASKRLSSPQKQDLVRMFQSGDKMNAIKQCREWTGLGLKEAKDMVEQYRNCLLEREEPEDEQREEGPGNRGSFSWKWCITDKEQEFSEEKSLESTMDKLLSDLSMRREESVTLIPPSPVLGISRVRACLDPQGIMFRVEVEYVEHDAQGKPKILYKNGLMSWDVRDIFVTFRRSARVRTDGWLQTNGKNL